MILVTGASGNAGGAVLKEVLKANRPIKAMYRSPEDAAKAWASRSKAWTPCISCVPPCAS